MDGQKTRSAFGLAAAAAILFNAGFTVVKESVPGLREALAGAFGHHWTGQALIVLALFVATGFLLARVLPARRLPGSGFLAGLLVASSVLSFLIIGGYFLWS